MTADPFRLFFRQTAGCFLAAVWTSECSSCNLFSRTSIRFERADTLLLNSSWLFLKVCRIQSWTAPVVLRATSRASSNKVGRSSASSSRDTGCILFLNPLISDSNLAFLAVSKLGSSLRSLRTGKPRLLDVSGVAGSAESELFELDVFFVEREITGFDDKKYLRVERFVEQY